MAEKKQFLHARMRNLVIALRGTMLLLTTEHAIMVQAVVGAVFIALGYIVQLSRIEWTIQLLCIGMVLAIEGANTAVEKLCDFIHPGQHPRIKFIKDISAGAVGFAALTALVVAIILYYPHFVHR